MKRCFFTSITRATLFLSAITLISCTNTVKTSDPDNDLQLVPITTTPTNTYFTGKIVWHDLLTPQADATRTFYGKLFGWTYIQHGRYTEILNNGLRIGGIAEIKPDEGKEVEARWLLSMSVPNVDKSSDFLKSNGGKINKGPVDMQSRGRGVLVTDPHGAQILLLRATGGDPADTDPAMGDWLWNEIWSSTPAETAAFYKSLGQYDAIIGGDDYQVMKSGDKWRAGIRHTIKDKEEFKQRWVPVIRVKNPATLLDKVENLGGIIWVRPDEISGKGNTALISDNAGALLILQSWSATEEKE